MTVSIILPVYNVAPWLEACLDSIAAAVGQAVSRGAAPQVEVLCVDDGSTDGSAQILDAWAARDESPSCRRRVLRQANAGVSAARNRGLAAAAGEIIAFADPDDTVGPDWLVRLLDGLTEADVAWAGCTRAGEALRPADVGAVYAGAAARTRIWRSVFGYRLRDLWKALLPGGLWRRCGRELGSVCWRAFRRETIGDVRFDPRLKLYEDAMFLAKVAPRVRRLRIVDDVSYRYRDRPSGAMTTEIATRRLENKFAMRDVRREIDPQMTQWRGTFLLSFLQVWKEAGFRAAVRYLR